MYWIFVATAWLLTLVIAAVAWLATYLLSLGDLSHLDSMAVFAFFAIPYLITPPLALLVLAHAWALKTHSETRSPFFRFAWYSFVLFGSTALILLWTRDLRAAYLIEPMVVFPPLAAWLTYSIGVIILGWMNTLMRDRHKVQT